MTVPIYLVARNGPRGDALALAFGGALPVVDSVEALGCLDDLPPGVVLIDRDGDASTDTQILDLATRVAGDSPMWRVGVEVGGDCRIFQSISLGPFVSAGEISVKVEDPAAAHELLVGIRHVLEEVAEARHLLNNQLTSALAETQLLLLDVTDDEARQSYVIILEQLRRMRSVIAGMIRIGGWSR